VPLFQAIAREHFQKDFAVKLLREFTVRLDDGQTHRFDLGSEQGDILIDCKSYTFTETGNEPAAELNHAKNGCAATESISRAAKN
jgi:hypothetical protein